MPLFTKGQISEKLSHVKRQGNEVRGIKCGFKKYAIILALCIVCTLFIGSVSASWAYMFVVNDGKIYVITEEQVEPSQIGSNIGKVTKYSDSEGTYSGNFSNRYPKGTKYFEIIGVEIIDAIAVKENEKLYVKATYGGEYASGRNIWSDYLPFVLIVPLVILAGYYMKKRLNR